MSLDTLIQELKRNPNFEVSSEAILPFVDGPEFFEGFLSVHGGKIKNYKSKLYKSERSLINLINQCKEYFRVYVINKYPTLDDLKEDKGLAHALGLPNKNGGVIAKACIEHEFLSPEIPDGHSISKKGGSRYVDPDVVEEYVVKNLKKYVEYTYKTLDNIKGHGNTRGHSVLASALGLSDTNPKTIAKACIVHEFLSPEIPDGHPISKTHGNWYLDPDVVGKEQVMKNLKKYVQYTYKTLDDINLKKTLSTVLEVPYKIEAIAKACIEHEFLSPEIPDGHSIGKHGHKSWYIDPAVVEEQVMKNLKRYVQYTYQTLDDIKKDHSLSTAFGVNNTPIPLRSKISELGWLENSHTYAEHSIPEQYKKRISTIKKFNGKEIKDIGIRVMAKSPNSTTFIKGMAFEQLFGLFLSYTNPNELVIPQYCLDVGEDYFRTRVDFKVGNNAYEVKWGNAPENIEETYNKHQKLLTQEKNRDLIYHLVRLDDQNGTNVQYENFNSLIERLSFHQSVTGGKTNLEKIRGGTELTKSARMPPVSDWGCPSSYFDKSVSSDIKDKFEILTAMLMESSERNETNEVMFLGHIRDFLYNVTNKANTIKGDERIKYLEDEIGKMYDLIGEREALDKYMTENTKIFFPSREAFFEHDGKLYRGFIDVQEVEREEPEKYQTIYYFGDIEFANELDRNLAVLIELSEHVKRVEDCLVNHEQLQLEPVFQIHNGIKISTAQNKNLMHVDSLEKAKVLLNLSDEIYSFGMDYIKTNGLRC